MSHFHISFSSSSFELQDDVETPSAETKSATDMKDAAERSKKETNGITDSVVSDDESSLKTEIAATAGQEAEKDTSTTNEEIEIEEHKTEKDTLVSKTKGEMKNEEQKAETGTTKKRMSRRLRKKLTNGAAYSLVEDSDHQD